MQKGIKMELPNRNYLKICMNCCKGVTYSLKAEKVKDTIRGVEFEYVELKAICDGCGEEIYVPAINDWNCLSRENGFYGKNWIKFNELLNEKGVYNGES